MRSGAVENMAIDVAMLELSGTRGNAFWRLYGWEEAAITFGYSQSWSWIRTEMSDFSGKCIRRVTGGGIVDHRNDLTYALAIPHHHTLYRDPALNIYRSLHQHITEILLDLGIPSDLAPCQENCGPTGAASVSGMCFRRPEPFDVVARFSGRKLAGAAMKRNLSGILVQGSLDMQNLPGISKTVFEREFGRALARWLDAERVTFNGTLPVELLSQNRRRFGSREWNEKR